MRHRNLTIKLGRKGAHRNAMLANMVCDLVLHGRVSTTLDKAKAARRLAERMVTLGKKGKLHHRRQALAVMHQKGAVAKLFKEVAPQHQGRSGGYTRIIRLGRRLGDAASMAVIEWVESAGAAPAAAPAAPQPAKES